MPNNVTDLDSLPNELLELVIARLIGKANFQAFLNFMAINKRLQQIKTHSAFWREQLKKYGPRLAANLPVHTDDNTLPMDYEYRLFCIAYQRHCQYVATLTPDERDLLNAILANDLERIKTIRINGKTLEEIEEKELTALIKPLTKLEYLQLTFYGHLIEDSNLGNERLNHWNDLLPIIEEASQEIRDYFFDIIKPIRHHDLFLLHLAIKLNQINYIKNRWKNPWGELSPFSALISTGKIRAPVQAILSNRAELVDFLCHDIDVDTSPHILRVSLLQFAFEHHCSITIIQRLLRRYNSLIEGVFSFAARYHRFDVMEYMLATYKNKTFISDTLLTTLYNTTIILRVSPKLNERRDAIYHYPNEFLGSRFQNPIHSIDHEMLSNLCSITEQQYTTLTPTTLGFLLDQAVARQSPNLGKLLLTALVFGDKANVTRILQVDPKIEYDALFSEITKRYPETTTTTIITSARYLTFATANQQHKLVAYLLKQPTIDINQTLEETVIHGDLKDILLNVLIQEHQIEPLTLFLQSQHTISEKNIKLGLTHAISINATDAARLLGQYLQKKYPASYQASLQGSEAIVKENLLSKYRFKFLDLAYLGKKHRFLEKPLEFGFFGGKKITVGEQEVRLPTSMANMITKMDAGKTKKRPVNEVFDEVCTIQREAANKLKDRCWLYRFFYHRDARVDEAYQAMGRDIESLQQSLATLTTSSSLTVS